MKKKQYAIIGLGTFGYNVALELMNRGMQVLVIDNDTEIINKISQFVTQTLIIDACDEKAMKSAGIANYDSVIISIDKSIEISILATLIVRNLGAKSIIVKSSSQWHSRIMMKLGVNTIVYPELDMAKTLADNIEYIKFQRVII